MLKQMHPSQANEIVPDLSRVEGELIQSCLAGDREAQRQLYEDYSDKVYRLICRMVGRSDAEDLTQHVFICAFERLAKFNGRSSFSTWLYRVAYNEALLFLRQRGRREMQSICGEPIDHRAGPNAQLDQRDQLEWALAQLELDLRVIFLLREVEELSYYEIAMTLDIPEGTVASRLNRARSCLRTLIL